MNSVGCHQEGLLKEAGQVQHKARDVVGLNSYVPSDLDLTATNQITAEDYVFVDFDTKSTEDTAAEDMRKSANWERWNF